MISSSGEVKSGYMRGGLGLGIETSLLSTGASDVYLFLREYGMIL